MPAIFYMLKITIKKYDPENFTAIVPLLFEIFGENPNSHLNEFWIKPFWREMSRDVTGSTQPFWLKENIVISLHFERGFLG